MGTLQATLVLTAFGAAVILLCVTMTIYAIYNRFVGLDKLWG